MNNLLSEIMDKSTIKMNKAVIEGVAKDILKTIPEYLNYFIIDSIKSLSKEVDLQYLGYRRITPKEEYEKTICNKDTGVNYDLAMNDVTMVEFKFSYMGTPFSRYLYLPYADRGNLIKFGDTYYHIIPVLSDTVISPDHKKVFVRLLKAKIPFMSVVKNFILDGSRVYGQLVYNEMLSVNSTQITDNIGKPLPATALYLLGKYGAIESIKKYSNAKEVIITDKNVDQYREEYHVYESTKQKPRGLKEYGYVGHDVKILVKKGVSNKSYIDNLIFGIIYTLDILPSHANDFVTLANSDVEQEILFWRIMMGRVCYKNSFSIDRIIDDVNAHYDLLDGYIDQLIKRKLSETGVKIDDFFDLVAYILSNYNVWLINSKEYNSDINNRYIDILYYLLYDIIIGFNKVILGINRRVNKRSITPKELFKIMNNELSPKLIYKLVNTRTPSLCLNVCDYTGDIIYPKVTSVLEDQSRGAGVRKGSKNQMPESAKTLKGTDLGFGSLLFLGKEAPSPRFKINVFMEYDIYSGKIIQSDKKKEILDRLNNLLQGRDLNEDLAKSELLNNDEID